MNSTDREESDWSGMGRWVAVASELPCSVIALLLVGQIVGAAVLGPSGAIWGALIGALLGFAFGSYGVYITIQYFDKLEQNKSPRRTYMPPKEEIYEDVKFEIEEDETS